MVGGRMQPDGVDDALCSWLGSAEVFDAEHNRGAVHAVEFLDGREGRLQFAEGTGVEQEDHVDESRVRIGRVDRRVRA